MSKQVSTLKAEVNKLKNHMHTFKRVHFGYISGKAIRLKSMDNQLIPWKSQGPGSVGMVTVKTSKPLY